MRRVRPQVIVDGHWLSALTPWGDLEWETVWPGGTEFIKFDVKNLPSVCRPGSVVELDWAGQRIAAGTLSDPTRGEQLYAEGLYRQAEDFLAVDNAGNITLNATWAVDEAQVRGMKFGRIQDLGVALLPTDSPLSVAKVLDAVAESYGAWWGIDPYARDVKIFGNQPASIHVAPGIDGFDRSRENLITRLSARYWTGSAYATVTAIDAAAEARWGVRVERARDGALADGTTISAAQAQGLVDGALATRNTGPGWTASIEVQYGDVLNAHGRLVEPASISAGVHTARVHGLAGDVADRAGASYADVPLQRVTHKDGAATLQPRGLVQPMNDVLAGVS